MELEFPLNKTEESFWGSIFSDLPAGLRRGNPAPTPGRSGRRDAKVHLPLAARHFSHPHVREETALRAAWAVVLGRHAGSSDVIFFSVIGDRAASIAPVRILLPPKQPVSKWLVGFEQWLGQAEENIPLPKETAAQIEDEGVAGLLTAFVVAPKGAEIFPGCDQLKSPLLVVTRRETSSIEIHYDSALFEEREVLALGRHFDIAWQGITDHPQSPVGTLPVLTADERHRLLTEWNDTATPFATNTCIHEFFEQQAAKTPDAIAVVFCDQPWTYRELNSNADALARRLISAGVGPGAFVAICLDRSLELMAALLAVLKAGAAYLPLDPAYPAERLAFMIEDAKPAVIVVSQKTENLFASAQARLFRVDGAEQDGAPSGMAPVPCQSSDAAYVLYTSGSTGKPKGVVVTHRNVSNFFTAMDGVIGTEPGVWLAVTSVNFDISVFELFWTLARGFRVILQEEGQLVSQTGSSYSLPEQMKRHGVTHLQCTPSLASMLVRDAESVAALTQLRRFMVGGEPLPLELGRRLAEIIAGELFNLYGPTETTVWSSAQRVTAEEKQILIGRPVANTRMYVLDAERELVPIGSVGELYIGGEGLAKEYLHRPEVTGERFVTHAFSPDSPQRLYRTGDLVRYIPDGRLEFMGRLDQQIKIRGVRVELGEIEAVLRGHADVRDAVVVVQQDGTDDKRLLAYAIAASPQAPSADLLQQWLATKLPKVLVPSAIVFLSEFPRTPNGKLDRRALPKIEPKESHAVPDGANDLERQIAAIWADVLGVGSVGVEQRFFDIGGHSLLMVEVHDRLRDELGHDVALLDLFRYPTVRSLAKYLGPRPAVAPAVSAGAQRGQLRQRSAMRGNGSPRRTASHERSL